MTKTPMHIRLLSILLICLLVLAGCERRDKLGDGDAATEPYLNADELVYEDITVMVSTFADLKDKLGEPDEHGIVEEMTGSYYFYCYGDVEFASSSADSEIIASITITGKDSLPVARDIKIGDSFADTIAKFPEEQAYTESTDGIFYGVFWSEGAGGAVNTFEDEHGKMLKSISITTADIHPALKIVFDEEDKINRITIIGIPLN